MTHTNCPHCRAALSAAQSQAGLQFCPACGGSFTQDGEAPAPAPPVAKPAAPSRSGPRVAKTLMWTGGPLSAPTRQGPSGPSMTRIAEPAAPAPSAIESPFAPPAAFAAPAPSASAPASNPFASPTPQMGSGTIAAQTMVPEMLQRPTTAAPANLAMQARSAFDAPAPAGERTSSRAGRSAPASRTRKPTPAPARRGRSRADADYESRDQEDESDAYQDEPRKSKGALVAVIVVGVLLAAGVVGLVVFGLGSKKPSKPASKPSKSLTVEEPPAPPPAPAALDDIPVVPAAKPVFEKPAKPVAEKPAPKPAVAKPVAEKPAAPSPEVREKEAEEAYQRGNAKLKEGALREAIAAFNDALKLNPRSAASHRGLGMAYAQAGNAAQAVKHLKAYLKSSPNAPDRALIEHRIAQLQ